MIPLFIDGLSRLISVSLHCFQYQLLEPPAEGTSEEHAMLYNINARTSSWRPPLPPSASSFKQR